MKYLNEPFVRYGFFLELNILLTSMQSILNSVLVLSKLLLLVENYVLSTHSYT